MTERKYMVVRRINTNDGDYLALTSYHLYDFKELAENAKTMHEIVHEGEYLIVHVKYNA